MTSVDRPTDLRLLERPEYELRVAADLTVELVKLRQNECKHLCIENVGPEIFGKLLHELYAPPTILATATHPRLQANGQPWDERPGAVNLVNI